MGMGYGTPLPHFTVPRSVTCARPFGSGAFFWPETCYGPDMSYSPEYLRKILRGAKCIACVGLSSDPVRPSYFVGRYLSLRGYRVIPVNPVQAGGMFFGEPIYGDLSEIPDEITVDMVDIFRRPEFVPEIYQAALTHLPGLRTVWMQIGVTHDETARDATTRGLDVVQDKCPKMEYQRLFGELRMAGINTGIISSRLHLR